jgi:hypothetical protein
MGGYGAAPDVQYARPLCSGLCMKDYITVDGQKVPMTNSMKELGKDWQGGTSPRPHLTQGTGEGGVGQAIQIHPLRAERRKE